MSANQQISKSANLIFKSSLSIILLFASSAASASECSLWYRDKLQGIADRVANKVVKGYDGGSNIEGIIAACDYNTYTRKTTIAVNVYWRGSFSGKGYNESGTVTFTGEAENPSSFSYTPTYASQSLKDYRMNRALFVGGMLLFGSALENSK